MHAQATVHDMLHPNAINAPKAKRKPELGEYDPDLQDFESHWKQLADQATKRHVGQESYERQGGTVPLQGKTKSGEGDEYTLDSDYIPTGGLREAAENEDPEFVEQRKKGQEELAAKHSTPKWFPYPEDWEPLRTFICAQVAAGELHPLTKDTLDGLIRGDSSSEMKQRLKAAAPTIRKLISQIVQVVPEFYRQSENPQRGKNLEIEIGQRTG